jgi:hypothetical protein
VLAAVFDAQANQIVPPQALNTAQTIRAGTAEITAMDGNRFAALWNDFTGSELLLDTGVFTTNLSTMGDDVFVGDAGNNLFEALGGEDTLTGGRGNDTLDGGDDIDRAVFDGTKAGYTLTLTPTGTTLTDRRTDGSGTDTLLNLEYLDFGETIGADAAGFALFQQVGIATLGAADLNSFVELYIAYFNRPLMPKGSGSGAPPLPTGSRWRLSRNCSLIRTRPARPIPQRSPTSISQRRSMTMCWAACQTNRVSIFGSAR